MKRIIEGHFQGEKLEEIEKNGFVFTRKIGAEYWKVTCRSCEVLVIQGWPTHETGCSNAERMGEDGEDGEDNG